MKKAVFLDRDGTINIDVGYLRDPEGLVLIRKAKAGVKLLKDHGYLVFIVTNQSGVGRGYFNLEELEAVHARLLALFAQDDIQIDGISYCPHTSRKKCSCRKPKPQMVHDLAQRYQVDLERSFIIGDKLIDVQTGKNASCGTILINTDTMTAIEDEADWVQPDFIAGSLYEAARWIVKRERSSNKKRQRMLRS